MNLNSFFKNITLSICIGLLTACGGGGGGGDNGSDNNPPVSPSGLIVSANDAANTLQWNAVSGATSYNIYWSTVSGTVVAGTKISNVSSPYSHTALTNGTEYYYVITAVNADGESAPSVETSGTPAVPPPDAPSLQSVIPGNQQNLLSWNPVDGATGYNLYWSTVSGETASGTQITNVSSPYLHTSLTNDTTYYYALTAVSANGESSTSTEVSATPFVPPYATQQYPFDLGDAPLSGYDETIPNDSTNFHYTLSVNPGSMYMFSLNNIVDGASLQVFIDDSWDQFSLSLVCSDYSYPYAKAWPQCIAAAPDSGLFYIRIAATTPNAENVSLKVDEVVNQGSVSTPIDLSAAPTSPVFGTVLEAGESIYQVAVTAGNFYRVILTDWQDSDAALSRLNLSVYDGAYSTPNRLCTDYGGNSEVDHEHRLRTIHCLAKPTANYLTIVTAEAQYGKGATYNIVVQEAVTEGSQSTPLNLSGDAFVHHGEVSADPDTIDFGYSYYQLSVTPNTDYLVDLRGMHVQLDFMAASDSGFTTNLCISSEFNLIDESCMVNSGASGEIYARVESDSDITDTFIISAMPEPVGAVVPARYPGEGTENTPIDIGPGLPITNRLSTVGTGASYYSLAVTPASTLQVTITDMNVDVDIHVYSEAGYLDRLCASRNDYVQDDSCSLTVPDGITTIYILVDGQFTTNNGSWSSKTEEDVGGMFRLTVEAL